MTEAIAPAPREQGWTKLLLALAAFLLVPILAEVRVVLPIEHTAILLVPGLAACALVGWLAGGRPLLALVTVGFAIWVLLLSRPDEARAYFDLARGWSLLVGGAFGLMCLQGGSRRFFPRALGAIGLAMFTTLALSAVGVLSLARIERVIQRQYAARGSESIAQMQQWIDQNPLRWREYKRAVPALETTAKQREVILANLPRLGIVVYPAMLALETLAALALAWALFHRFSRTRIGAPLSRLRDFRFNDQLVWGPIVGMAIVLLPTLASLRETGANLLVFFGALYALRGLGVVAWFLAPSAAGTVVAVILALFLWPLVPALSFGVGLGDTWFDWRRLTRAAPRVNP